MSESKTEVEKPNPMRELKIAKVTVNIGVGKSGEPLEKAKKVLNQITNRTPCPRKAKKTIKEFGIRKGEPMACAVTLRRDEAKNFLKKALEAAGNKIRRSSFDRFGNFAFGIKEHIEIPGTKYVPELGIFGMDVAVTFERRGFRVRRRAIRRSDIGRGHLVSRDEAVEFVRSNFGTEIVGE
jgi:large subunit ribosomal protein L5